MAPAKVDGSVVTWGSSDSDGDSPCKRSFGNVMIVGNWEAFAALNGTGGVVAWGKVSCGGEIPADKAAALARRVAHKDCAEVSVPPPGVQFTSAAMMRGPGYV